MANRRTRKAQAAAQAAHNAQRAADFDSRMRFLTEGTRPEDRTISDGSGSVNGGFRAGKRKRGNSLLNVNAKRRAKSAPVRIVSTYDALLDGTAVATGIRTLRHDAPVSRVAASPGASRMDVPRGTPDYPTAHTAREADAKLDALFALLDAKAAASEAATRALRTLTQREEIVQHLTIPGERTREQAEQAYARMLSHVPATLFLLLLARESS